MIAVAARNITSVLISLHFFLVWDLAEDDSVSSLIFWTEEDDLSGSSGRAGDDDLESKSDDESCC